MADKNLPTLLTDEVDPKDAVDNAPERYGTRKRELTMKGHEYQVTIKSNQLKQSMSKWRKQADKLDNLLQIAMTVSALSENMKYLYNVWRM